MTSFPEEAAFWVDDDDPLCDHGREVSERSGLMAHIDDGTLCARASRDVLRALRVDTSDDDLPPNAGSAS